MPTRSIRTSGCRCKAPTHVSRYAYLRTPGGHTKTDYTGNRMLAAIYRCAACGVERKLADQPIAPDPERSSR